MVETFDVSITPYGLTRRTFVYLPDDWQTSGKKYPVLYMFDGHNLFFDLSLIHISEPTRP